MKLEDAMEEVFDQCAARMVDGAAEYGRLSFLDKDMLPEMEEELLDFINYAVMFLIQLRHMKQKYTLE